MRGFVPTAMREGLWSVGYLAFPPIIRSYLSANHAEHFQSEDKARFVAALGGAFISGIMSHPFDTVKTCMQGDIERRTFRGMAQTFAELLKQGGPTAFYRGYLWRFARQVGAIFILDKVRSELTPIVFPHAA